MEIVHVFVENGKTVCVNMAEELSANCVFKSRNSNIVLV